MVIATRPDHAVQVAFNADPNDPAAVPTWSNLTSPFLGASGAKRGKQYELDLAQSAQPSLAFLDPNEYLNPGNPSSPYAPNVVPLRQVLWQAMWPNTTVGNLLAGQLSPVLDPSFESYTNGASLSWVLTNGSGVTPTVTTTNPQQGTKSLTYNVTAGAGTSGVGLTITCIPGRQYTSSLYLRQTAANTTQIFINGDASGTSTATTGAYVRLTVTWTATQPTHQLWVTSTTTGTSGTCNVDAIQHEQAASASAFVTTGPVIYPVLRDYMERWPHTWDQDTAGYLGLCDTNAVDAFAVLAGTDLWTEVRNSILAKAPTYYWALNEPQGATSFAETSGNSGPSLTRMDSQFGPAPTFAAGVQTKVPGDLSGTGLNIDTAGVGTNVPNSVIQTGWRADSTPLNFGGGPPLNWSVAFFVSRNTPAPLGGQGEQGIIIGKRVGSKLLTMPVLDTPAQIWASSTAPGPAGATAIATDVWADGKPHLVIVVGTITTTTTTVNLWIDGAQVATATNGTVSGFTTPYLMDFIEVGGYYLGNTPGPSWAGGIYSHVALWTRALSNAEIADLDNARKGYLGEGSGARITRYLGYGWTGTSAIDAGQSVMGVSNLATGTSLLAACQSVTTSENGNFFANASGSLVFQGRLRRYQTTTPTYVFGENTAGGELPYLGDVRFDLDLTQVYNSVVITNSGGITATASDATSQKRYFPRGFPRTVNVGDLEATDAANWILATHKNPVQRVDQITLDPGANPNLWPVVLSLEIGTRVTVKKRSKGANVGAGLTQSADFFVESIEHSNIDLEAGTWTTTLLLSPAAAALQPGLFDDTVYGKFDSTLIFAY